MIRSRTTRTLPLLILLFASATAAGAPSWQQKKQARDRLTAAIAALASDDLGRAAGELTSAAGLDPTDPRPRFLRALVHLEVGAPLEALHDLDEAARLAPEDVAQPLRDARRRALRALGDSDALKELEKAEKEAGDSPPETEAGGLWRAWGLLRRGTTNLETARGEVARSIARHSRRNPYLGRLTASAIHLRLGNLEKAQREAGYAVRHPNAGPAAQISGYFLRNFSARNRLKNVC